MADSFGYNKPFCCDDSVDTTGAGGGNDGGTGASKD